MGRAARAAYGVLGLWGVLVGVGLAPTAAALVAALTGSMEWLWLALAVSLASNGVLAYLAVRYRRRILRIKGDLGLLLKSWDGTEKPTRWMPRPGDIGSMVIGLADLEEAWERLATKARTEIAPDAILGLVAITLEPVPSITASGWSADTQIGFNAGCHFDGEAWISAFRDEKASSRGEPLGVEPAWRTDDSWRELLRRSWLRERPFVGDVSLDILRFTTLPQEQSMRVWRINYDRVEGGIRHKRVNYRFVNGELLRSEGFL